MNKMWRLFVHSTEKCGEMFTLKSARDRFGEEEEKEIHDFLSFHTQAPLK
jgi:hypothetical protein